VKVIGLTSSIRLTRLFCRIAEWRHGRERFFAQISTETLEARPYSVTIQKKMTRMAE